MLVTKLTAVFKARSGATAVMAWGLSGSDFTQIPWDKLLENLAEQLALFALRLDARKTIERRFEGSDQRLQ